MGKRTDYFHFSVLILLLPMLFPACAGAPPMIEQLFWQLDVVLDQNSRRQHEELSLFLMVDDADGIGDVDEMIICHEEQELAWRIPAEDLRRIEREGETWIGASGLQMNDRSPLPRGNYTVEVIDKAGEKDEDEFFFQRKISGLQDGDIDLALFPDFSLNATAKLYQDQQLSVFLYNQRKEFVNSETIQDGFIDRETLQRWRNSEIFEIWLHTYNREDGFGLVSGPYGIKP